MRVNSERQTLILAGETPPPRSGGALRGGPLGESPVDLGESSWSGAVRQQRTTVISTRIDATVTESIEPWPAANAILPQRGAGVPMAELENRAAKGASNRGPSFGGAGAYARTRDFADKVSLVDTYA